jgi:hypothetical protein
MQEYETGTTLSSDPEFPFPKKIDVGIVFKKNDKRKIKKFEKLYTKKHLFIISRLYPPIEQYILVKGLQKNRLIHKAIFLEDFKYFDKLKHLEVK